jgi:hypothetical protein
MSAGDPAKKTPIIGRQRIACTIEKDTRSALVEGTHPHINHVIKEW